MLPDGSFTDLETEGKPADEISEWIDAASQK